MAAPAVGALVGGLVAERLGWVDGRVGGWVGDGWVGWWVGGFVNWWVRWCLAG